MKIRELKTGAMASLSSLRMAMTAALAIKGKVFITDEPSVQEETRLHCRQAVRAELAFHAAEANPGTGRTPVRRRIWLSNALDCSVQRASSPASAPNRAFAASILALVVAASSSSACFCRIAASNWACTQRSGERGRLV